MKLRNNIPLEITISSILMGLLLGSSIMVIDFSLSKILSEQDSLLPFMNGGLILRIIIYFLSMSFVLLIRILLTTEKIFHNNSKNQAISDKCLNLFASSGFSMAKYSPLSNGNKFIIKEVNDNLKKIEKVGDEILGKEIRDVFPGVEKFGLLEPMKRVFLTSTPEIHDLAKYTDSARSGWKKNFIFKTNSGDIVCLYQDTTSWQECETKLKKAEITLDILSESLPFFFILLDKDDIVKKAFGKIINQFSTPNSVLEGAKIDLLFSGNPKVTESIAAARNGLDFSTQILFHNKIFELRFLGLSGKGGEAGEIAIIGQDISEKTLAQVDISRLETAIHQSDEIVMITDTKGVIQYVNPAIEKITGYITSEVIGKNSSILKSGLHDKSFYSELWSTISQGKVWRGHLLNRKKDGTIYEEDAVISPVRNKTGEIINYVAVKRDVSKEADLQRQLMQAQKMEAIGRFAGGIAHDFNNILTAILGYSDLAVSMCKNNEMLRDSIEQIRSAGKRASALTKQLLAFTRKQVLNIESVCMKELVNEMKDMLRRLIGEEVSLEFKISESPLYAKADRGQIEQVLMNLVLNAKDALPSSGGIITVTLSKHIQKTEYDYSGFKAASGEYVKLVVKDNGHGMTDDVKIKIFDPFFTTKPKGKGTGLGLSTVYGIVQQHYGFITFDSAPGKGTIFEVFIPIAEKENTHQKKEGSDHLHSNLSLESSSGDNKIALVAEDDKVIQMLVSSYLAKEGYKVLLAGDGLEAKQILVHRGAEISYALIDLVMPFLDGGKLAEYILKIYPNIKIILMSGYPDTLNALNNREGKEVKKLPLLQKPFTQVELKSFIDKYFCQD